MASHGLQTPFDFHNNSAQQVLFDEQNWNVAESTLRQTRHNALSEMKHLLRTERRRFARSLNLPQGTNKDVLVDPMALLWIGKGAKRCKL